MGESIALRPATNCRPICAKPKPAEGFGRREPVGGGLVCAKHPLPERLNLFWNRPLSVSAGVSWMPAICALFTARFQIVGIQSPEPPVADSQLKSAGFCGDLSFTKLRHQVPHESSAVALAQLLVCFFSCHQPYGEPPIADKICAKTLKTGKMEVSTHVFGSFNARKAERLIAPQHQKRGAAI